VFSARADRLGAYIRGLDSGKSPKKATATGARKAIATALAATADKKARGAGKKSGSEKKMGQPIGEDTDYGHVVVALAVIREAVESLTATQAEALVASLGTLTTEASDRVKVARREEREAAAATV
jgi:hypothetical protein